MAIIRRDDITIDHSAPNTHRLTLINAELGAGHWTVGELAIDPGQKVPLHVHATHEEGMYILDGPMNYTLGDETGVLNTGDVMFAPAGIKHDLTNTGDEPRRVMFIFPTTNIVREDLD